MKRILISSAAFLALMSCGNNAASTASPSATSNAPKVVTLRVLNYVDLSNPAEEGSWKQFYNMFSQKYPNIKLEVENLYDEAFHQKVKALAGSGNLPDVLYMFPGGRSSELFENKLVEDLRPYLNDVRADFSPATFTPQGKNGEIYELPIALTTTHVMYTNTKILADNSLAMPKTYDELKAITATLKEKGIDNTIMANKDAWVMNSTLLGTIIGRLGGPTWVGDAVDGKHKFTDEVFVNSLKIIKDMYTSGIFSTSSIQLGYGDSPNLFAEGKGAFMIDGDWRSGALDPIMTPDQQKATELLVIPALPGEKFPNITSMVPGTGMGMKVGLADAQKEAALTFIKFYAGKEASEIRLRSGAVIPSHNLNMDDYPEVPLFLKKRVEMNAKYGAAQVVDNYVSGKANDALNTGMQEIALGLKTPEQVATEVETLIRQK